MDSNLEQGRHEPAIGDAPPPPPFFDYRYRPPPHRVKLLEQKNPHERDACIVFHELPHIYVVKGEALDTSVTSVAHSFCEDFDESSAIMMMKKTRKQCWPRYPYAVNIEEVEFQSEIPNGKKVIVYDSSKGLSLQHLETWPSSFKHEASYVYYAFERGMTDEEIKNEWEKSRTDGANRGTEAHLMMELWMNSEPCRISDTEVQTGLKFVRDQLIPIQCLPYRTEWEIWADDEKLAGSIDMVGVLSDGSFVIIDWKRCKHLDHDVVSKFGKTMKSPLSHLHDCSGCRYTLQLSIYAWILEKYYNMKISGLALCSLHPDHPFHTWMPYLKVEVEYLMEQRRHKLAAMNLAQKKNIDEDLGLPRCAMSNKLLFDAVKFKGELYNRVDLLAIENEAEFEHVDQETQKVKNLLDSIQSPVSSFEPLLSLQPRWEQRITERGHPDFFTI